MAALHGPVDTLRNKLGLPAGAGWSGVSSVVLIPAQQRAGLLPTGRFDPQTALAFGYYSDDQILPADHLAYVRGGPQVGSFGRDVATASAQIPWWAWTAAGIGLVGLGVFIYAKNRKKGPKV